VGIESSGQRADRGDTEMPKGIAQEQVNAAADALVAAGDKPTVEKIRQVLGTGSPNTVMRMLEVWRGSLAERLQKVITLPEVPSEVGHAFADTWRLALAHAEDLARAALVQEQNALLAAQTSLTQERKVWEITLAEAQTMLAENVAQRQQAEAQLRERQALVGQLEAQQIDLLQQRDRLQAQVERHQAEEEEWRAERAAVQGHLRAQEDRAHQQIDVARQEVKVLQQRLEREQREHAKATNQYTAQQDELRAAVRTAEQAGAHQAGRIAALEAALHQWRAQPSRLKQSSSKPRTQAKPKRSQKPTR
jgi:hypothetical protein